MNRREFLFSAGATALLSGCRDMMLEAPDLRFGVVSDIHVTTPKSCWLFERALRYFKRFGVDAVMVPGDLTDWGLKECLGFVGASWKSVFGETDVVPLFCTGNHEYAGWNYSDISIEMQANGYSHEDRLVKVGMAEAWRGIFDEEFAAVRCRSVKGYDFVSGEWGAKGLGDWMARNGSRLSGDRPFFYFQHAPIAGTTADSPTAAESDEARQVLNRFPNCIAFTGHTHRSFIDERSIWQGEFTAIATPSLSYACWPLGYENGAGERRAKSGLAMGMVPTRRDLRGGQGYFVSVWPSRIVIERIDLEEEDSDAPAWALSLPACRTSRPYAFAARAAKEPVPAFPEGAVLDIGTRNTENRDGHWAIVMNCEFPSAEMPRGCRVFDYEIRTVLEDGAVALTKLFASPAYAKMAKYEPRRQRFWFDVMELPRDRPYVIEVRARNCFGRCSKPLISPVQRVIHDGLGRMKAV